MKTPKTTPYDPDAALLRAQALLERKRIDPASVPYTLEQCEALIAAHIRRMERQRTEWHTRDAERRAWASAKQDPAGFFSDRTKWPEHISTDEARAQAFFWASRLHLDGTYGEAGEIGAKWYAYEWPLPVGRKALQKWAAEIERWGTQHDQGQPLVLSDAMPFTGNERAAWIFAAAIEDAWVESFGLVKLEDSAEGTNGEDGEDYVIDEIAFRVTGPNPASQPVQAFTKDVRDWWTILRGERLKGSRGRPPKSKHDPEDIARAYRAHYHQTGRYPDQQEVASELGVTARTVRRNIQGDWADFERSVRGQIEKETR